MEILESFTLGITILVAIKAVAIGSDFSFYYWYKHRDTYWKWYNSRSTFEDYLTENKTVDRKD